MGFINLLVSIVFLPAVIVRSGVGKSGLDEPMTNSDRVFTFVPMAVVFAFHLFSVVMLVQMVSYHLFFDLRETTPWMVAVIGTAGVLIRWWVVSDESAVKLEAARKAINETLLLGLLGTAAELVIALTQPNCQKVGLIMAGIGFVLALQALVAKIFLSKLQLPSEEALEVSRKGRRKVVKPTTPLLKAKARVKAMRRRANSNR